MEKIKWIDDLIQKDKRYGLLTYKVQELRHKRNQISKQISKLRKQRKSITKLIKTIKNIPKQIEKTENESEKLKEKIDWYLLRLPNLMHPSVPVGEDETGNVVMRKWGKPKKFGFKPKDHIDIGLGLDLIDVERGTKISGARFYFLKNEAVLLEFALVRFALDFLLKKEFTLMVPPVLIREKVMQGAGWLPIGEEDVYRIKTEDLYLAGTAEQPLAGLHMNETLKKSQLPLYYAGFSTCFRPEAGTHGRDTKGIFRVHQFDKVEMFKFVTPENSWEEFESLLKTAEEIQQKLGLPYRVVNICSAELGMVAAKKCDIEAWLPGQNKYREIVSCSNCTDFQARRLNIKFIDEKGDKKFVHTLNSTAIAIGRTIVAILENYQQKDGSVAIPTILQPYMNGMKKIERK